MKTVKLKYKGMSIIMNLKKYLYLVALNRIPCKNKSGGALNMVKHMMLQNIFKYIGPNVNIRPCIKFAMGCNISIGENSGIGDNCFLQDIGDIIIGEDVLMGPEVMIFTANHNMKKDELIRTQESLVEKVVIEDDVWIGARSIILPGVKLCKGAVIAAGAVVTRNVEPYTIVGGVPAKKIGVRE